MQYRFDAVQDGLERYCTGQKGGKTGGMQDRKYAGQKGCMTEGMQDRWDSGQKGCRTEGMQNRIDAKNRDAGHDRSMRGGTQESRDAK